MPCRSGVTEQLGRWVKPLQIPVPLWLMLAWDKFVDWGDVVVWRPIDKFELLRIDLFMAVLFVVVVAGYGYWYGWQGALQGSVMFAVVGGAALMFRK